ncbi:hypothetical protein [Devosia rhizoryzae]|uniref:Uncharacterized protein n=1 Tax=Devosia rhizoryzae TaxID=2774137 RepID=A0ABX7C639_9HYPH|nr:hypothetical protein [Devosia rhizoryzae]QQR38729.1 hypothetical protein JI748_13315 [Devosia rhizoryzae]
MPQPYRGERPYPGKEWTLRHAADDGQIVICKCGLCKREVRYLATDLIQFFAPSRDALDPPFGCANCGPDGWVRVTLTYPTTWDYGVLMVRRPGAVRQIQTWKWVKLGD